MADTYCKRASRVPFISGAGDAPPSPDATPLRSPQARGGSGEAMNGTASTRNDKPYRFSEEDYWKLKQVQYTLGLLSTLACGDGSASFSSNEELSGTAGFLRDTLQSVLDSVGGVS